MQKIFWLVALIFSGNHDKLCSCFCSNYVFLQLEGIWTRSILMLRTLLLIAISRHSWPLNSYLLIISYLSFVFFSSIYLYNLIKFLLNLKEPLYCSPLFKKKLSVFPVCTYILVLGQDELYMGVVCSNWVHVAKLFVWWECWGLLASRKIW